MKKNQIESVSLEQVVDQAPTSVQGSVSCRGYVVGGIGFCVASYIALVHPEAAVYYSGISSLALGSIMGVGVVLAAASTTIGERASNYVCNVDRTLEIEE